MSTLCFTDVNSEIFRKITEKLLVLRHTPILISRKTNHPGDTYLYLVLAEKIRDEKVSYTVWTYNAEQESLESGVYDLKFPKSLEIMSKRMFYIESKI